jgi:DHA2 family methylenomycin A resistance protein-like MFS transporter
MSRRAILLVACFGLFFVQLDVTIVNVALKPIAAGLDTGTAGLQWVVDGYALALSALILSAGDVADLAGRRRVFVAGLAIFGAASAVCALAPGPAVLIGGRALQGVGAAALLPTSLAIVNHAFPDPRERAQAIGAWAGVSALALVSGPVIGGVLVSGLGWRAVFWLNVPLCALAVVLARRTVPESADPRGRALDLPGQALAIVALTALVFAIIEGRRLGWGSPAIVTAIAVAVAALAAFVRVELHASHPMLDLRYFRSPRFSGANAASGLMNLGVLGWLFAFSLFLQQGQGHSPIATGVRLLPLFAPLALLAPLAGRLASAAGPRLPAAAGLGLTGVAFLALSGTDASTGYGSMWLPLALAGLGLAAATPALVSAATAAIPKERAGIAAGVNNGARQTGGAVGVALIGGIAALHAAVLTAAGVLLAGAAVAGAGLRD